MATKQLPQGLQMLHGLLSSSSAASKSCLTAISRTFATETMLPHSLTTSSTISSSSTSSIPPLPLRRPPPAIPNVPTIIYAFPSLEPVGLAEYSANQLFLPLRRDLLHRAVVFEADCARQGTASTKWRSDVAGSGRKIRPQKGSGRARLGDRKSPMLRGGGVAHGPHPRSFATRLPRKIYDVAWRTALSYRYRRGELIVVADGAEIEMAEPRWWQHIAAYHGWAAEGGRSLLVTAETRPLLFEAVTGAKVAGRAKTVEEVDVRDLLRMARVVVEKEALDMILAERSTDLDRTVPSAMDL